MDLKQESRGKALRPSRVVFEPTNVPRANEDLDNFHGFLDEQRLPRNLPACSDFRARSTPIGLPRLRRTSTRGLGPHVACRYGILSSPKIHRRHRCGDIQLSRTVKTKASARGASRLRRFAHRFFFSACGLDSPCCAESVPHRRGSNAGYAARATAAIGAGFCSACMASNGCPFVTTAHATCNSLRAAAQRATFIGLPAARRRS